MRKFSHRVYAIMSTVVIARHTFTNAVVTFTVAAGFLLLAIYWLLAAPSSMAAPHTAGLAAVTALVFAYYFWRFGSILYACLFRECEGIVVTENIIRGLGRQPVSIADVTKIELKLNSVGRAVLVVHLHSHKTKTAPLGGMQPSPTEIAERLSETISKNLVISSSEQKN